MTDAAAFIAAICADPSDDAPRLQYADWLDEQGQGERGEFIRVQIAIANAAPCDWMSGKSCDPAGLPPCDRWNATRGTRSFCQTCMATNRLRDREKELWGYLPTRDGILRQFSESLPGFAALLSADSGKGLSDAYPWATVSRGFVAAIRMSWADCERHLDAIAAEHPVTEVTLTTVPDAFAMPGIRWPRIRFSATVSSQRWTEFRVRDDFTHSPSR
jgi:uncharacterized protein (TIGR02996 family)